MRTTFLAFVAPAIVIAASSLSLAQDKPSDTLIEKLQGRWEIVAGVNQGRELSDTEVEGTYVTISTNTIITYDRTNQERYRAVFRLNTNKEPAHITMTALPKKPRALPLKTSEGPERPVSEGILRIESPTRWLLCYALPGSDRPKNFASAKGSQAMFFVLEKRDNRTANQ